MAETTLNPASALEGIEFQGGEFASLLNKEFKPKSDDAKTAVEQAVLTLAQQALVNTTLIGSDVMMSIEAMIAELDKRLSTQVNAILHHADFQQVESAWRGLHYLVNNTETDEMLKIRVFNITKQDWARRSSATRERPGTRARCSRRCTRRSTASSAANPSAASWATTTSTTARRTSNCWAR
jgi:predicted component of type VI protein secretion system